MRFIVKDEPAGWAISVWVMDDRPTGWMLMVADSVLNGEIIWRWDPIHEGTELPQPTFRFNWDFIEEFAHSIIKKRPKRVDDEIMKTLDIERSRVDTLLSFLTHKQMSPDNIYPTPPSQYDELKAENAHLKSMVQDLQAQLLQVKSDVQLKKSGMASADQIIKEVYSDTPSFVNPTHIHTSPGPSPSELKALMELGMVTPKQESPFWLPPAIPQKDKGAFVKAVEFEIKKVEEHLKQGEF